MYRPFFPLEEVLSPPSLEEAMSKVDFRASEVLRPHLSLRRARVNCEPLLPAPSVQNSLRFRPSTLDDCSFSPSSLL